MKKYSLALLVFCAGSALGMNPALYPQPGVAAARGGGASTGKPRNIRSIKAIEKDIKNVEKKIADIDKQIKTNTNTQTITGLRGKRRHYSRKLSALESELKRNKHWERIKKYR